MARRRTVKFSSEAEEVFSYAHVEARERGHTALTPLHLLFGLLKEPTNAVGWALRDNEFTIRRLKDWRPLIEASPSAKKGRPSRLNPDETTAAIIDAAAVQARGMRHKEVTPEHLMLGALAVPDNSVLRLLDHWFDLNHFRTVLLDVLNGAPLPLRQQKVLLGCSQVLEELGLLYAAVLSGKEPVPGSEIFSMGRGNVSYDLTVEGDTVLLGLRDPKEQEVYNIFKVEFEEEYNVIPYEIRPGPDLTRGTVVVLKAEHLLRFQKQEVLGPPPQHLTVHFQPVRLVDS